jgi:hypothetical protein
VWVVCGEVEVSESEGSEGKLPVGRLEVFPGVEGEWVE